MPDNISKTISYTSSVDAGALRISVVIPTFNRLLSVKKAIQSVLDQSVVPAEVLVVDDGSSDGTGAMITREFGNRVRYHYQKNHGVSHARNMGIKLSSGDWIAFLDSDDQWMPDKLQFQIDAIQANPRYKFCHTNEIWIRNGKRVNPMNKHQKAGGFIYRDCLPLCAISPSSVLIKKQVFSEIGLFDESMPVCEDYDYWLRYCAANPVLYVEEPQLIKYGGHEDQLSRRYWGMDRFRIQALLKILAANILSAEDRAATIETLLEKLRILQTGAEKHGNSSILKFCQIASMQLESIQNHLRHINETDLSSSCNVH